MTGVLRRGYRTAGIALGKAIGVAICEPQMRLGRRRHDGHCDHCGKELGPYRMEMLDFPLDDYSPETSSTVEKIRSMMKAEYVAICLECPEDAGIENSEEGDLDE